MAATTDTKPTGVLPGAFLTVSGDGSRTNYIKTGYTHEAWVAIGGGGGGSTDPAGSNTQVQFNNNGVFGATTGLTFDGQRLFANNLQVSGVIYDSNVSVGENGMVLTNEGQTGIHWKNIESVLSGVGGSGVANYVARWSDEDTLTSGTIYDDGDVGIGTANPGAKLHVYDTVVSDMVILESSGPSAVDGPDVIFYRNSVSPADSDDLGILKFRGRNNASPANQDVNYAQIEAEAISVADGAEGGALNFHTYDNGTSATRMVVTGDNVGIGTTTPFRKFHVYATGDQTNENNGAFWIGDSTNNKMGLYGGVNNTNNYSYIGSVRTSQAYEDLILNPNGGKVGVVCTSPAYQLSVGNDNNGLHTDNGTDFSIGQYGSSANILALHSAGDMWLNIDSNSNDTTKKLYIAEGGLKTAASAIATFQQDGNVGIGTASPGVKLHVYGGNIRISSTDDKPQLEFFETAAARWVIGHSTAPNNYFAISEGSDVAASERLVIAPTTGSVGIGYATPAYALDIRQAGADIFLSSTTGTNRTGFQSANTGGVSYFYRESSSGGGAFSGTSPYATAVGGTGAYPLQLGTNNAVRMTIDSAGKVGIGTPTPQYALEVAVDGGEFDLTDSGDSYNRRVRLGDSSGNGGYITVYNDSEVGNVILRSYGDSSFTGGDVGIGIASPDVRFHVETSVADVLSKFINTDGTNGHGLLVKAGGSASGKYIATFRDAANNTRMHLLADGNVGIGTTDPAYLFDVSDDSSNIAIFRSSVTNYARVIIRAGAAGDAQLSFQNNTSTKWTIGNDGGDSDKFKIETGGGAFGASPLVCILSGGNFGIGTNAPAVKLHVLGSTAKIERTGDAPTLQLYNNASNPADGAALGYVSFMGTDNDGTANQTYANIGGHCETNTDTNVTGYLTFNTTRAGTAVTEQMRIISGTAQMRGQLGLGCTPHQYAKLHTRTDGTDNELRIEAYRNDVGQTSVRGYFSRGSAASPVIVQDNDTIFELQGWAGDGTDHHRVAEIDFQVDGTPGNNDMPGRLVFSTTADGASAPTERMRILSDGKVGIGTNAPNARLEVEDGGTASSVILKVTADDQSPYALMVGNDTYSTTDTDGIGMWINNAGQGKLHARGTGSQLILGAAGTNYVYLLSDGKVGIGTNAPTKFLHVRAPASSTGGVIALLQSHDTANGWLQIQGSAGNSWEIGATDSGFQFYDDETAAYKVTIKNSGDVGIGVSSLKTWYAGITQLALGSNRGTVVANASYIGVMENAYLKPPIGGIMRLK